MRFFKYLLIGLTLLLSVSIANAKNFDLFSPSNNLNIFNKSSDINSANLGQKIITSNAIKQAAVGDTIIFTIENKPYQVIINKRVVHDADNVSFIGFIKNTNYRTMITRGKMGSIGSIKTENGQYNIEQNGDGEWLVSPEDRQHLTPIPLGDDAVIPDNTQLLQTPALKKKAQNSLTANSSSTNMAIIDIMVFWDQEFETAHGSADSAKTKLNAKILYSNTAFSDSNIYIRLNLVHSGKISYSNSSSNSDALSAIKNGSDVFSGVAALRTTHSADLVGFLRDYKRSHGGAGLAYRLGASLAMPNAYKNNAFFIVGDGRDGSYSAPESTFPHEVGHNLGSGHDRNHYDGSPIFSYSYGYDDCPNGDDCGTFGTVMSYDGPRVAKFSNPDIMCTSTQACGSAVGNTDEANNALGFNNIRFDTAGFYTSTSGITTPNNVSASDGLDNNKVRISWNGVSGAGSYQVYRSDSSAGAYSLLGNVSLSSYDDISATAGVTYYYKIKACTEVNGGGTCSAYSDSNAGSTLADYGNSRSFATTIDKNSTTIGEISVTNDIDYFKIVLSTAGTLTLTVSGTNHFSKLESVSNVYLKTGNNITKFLSAGTYYIHISGNAGAKAGVYNLVVALATTLQTEYMLTISATNGSVSSNPNGISCGSDCSENFAQNTSVALTATADTGYTFNNWLGSCSGSSNPLTVAMSSNKSCTANFVLNYTAPPIITKFTIRQGSKNGRLISKSGGDIVISATVIDADTSASALNYTWTGYDFNDTDSDNKTFTSNPTGVNIGTKKIKLVVNDGTNSSERTLNLKLISEAVSSGDSDGDGIPDNIDNHSEANILQAGSKAITSPTGTKILLGIMGNNSALLTLAQMKQYITDNNLSDNTEDTSTTGDIYDYVIEGLTAPGETSSIIIELTTPIPADAGLRKYSLATGWTNFVVDANNTIQSKNATNCSDTNWQTNLITGATCLKLTLKDGGENDTDGKTNGTIADPVAVSTPKVTTIETSSSSQSNSGGGGGGGAISWWFLLILLLMVFIIKTPKYIVKK